MRAVLPLLVLALPMPASAVDLHVGPAQPYATLADAFAVASSGDRILPDPGVHAVSGIVLTFLEVEVVGAVGVVFDGASNATGTMFDISQGSSLTIETVEIRANGSQAFRVAGAALHTQDVSVRGASSAIGGGLYAIASEIEWESGSFEDNVAWSEGGDVYLSGCAAAFHGTTFTRSSAPFAASLHADEGDLELDGVTFSGIVGQSTEVVPTSIVECNGELTLRNSRFEGNHASGGSLLDITGARATLEDSTFEGNSTGEALVHTSTSTTLVAGNLFCGNVGELGVVALHGDAISGTFRNNVVLAHTSIQGGVEAIGAILDVRNNHFVGNVSSSVGSTTSTLGGSSAVLVNNVVAFTTDLQGPGLWTDSGSPVDFPFGALWRVDPEPTLVDDSTVVRDDPLITAPAAGDCDVLPLVPRPGSPLIDAGDPSLLDTDGTRSDIGAFGGEDPFSLWEWPDADADGFTEDLDCDDTNPLVYPGAPEVLCDGLDNDCLDVTPDAPDGDADGVSVCDGDCDDSDAAVYPGVELFVDLDGDGFGAGEGVLTCSSETLVASSDDCDDQDPDVFPGAIDLRDDGVDQDCDGSDLDTRLDGAVGCACAARPGPVSGGPWLEAALTLRRR